MNSSSTARAADKAPTLAADNKSVKSFKESLSYLTRTQLSKYIEKNGQKSSPDGGLMALQQLDNPDSRENFFNDVMTVADGIGITVRYHERRSIMSNTIRTFTAELRESTKVPNSPTPKKKMVIELLDSSDEDESSPLINEKNDAIDMNKVGPRKNIKTEFCDAAAAEPNETALHSSSSKPQAKESVHAAEFDTSTATTTCDRSFTYSKSSAKEIGDSYRSKHSLSLALEFDAAQIDNSFAAEKSRNNNVAADIANEEQINSAPMKFVSPNFDQNLQRRVDDLSCNGTVRGYGNEEQGDDAYKATASSNTRHGGVLSGVVKNCQLSATKLSLNQAESNLVEEQITPSNEVHYSTTKGCLHEAQSNSAQKQLASSNEIHISTMNCCINEAQSDDLVWKRATLSDSVGLLNYVSHEHVITERANDSKMKGQVKQALPSNAVVNSTVVQIPHGSKTNNHVNKMQNDCHRKQASSLPVTRSVTVEKSPDVPMGSPKIIATYNERNQPLSASLKQKAVQNDECLPFSAVDSKKRCRTINDAEYRTSLDGAEHEKHSNAEKIIAVDRRVQKGIERIQTQMKSRATNFLQNQINKEKSNLLGLIKGDLSANIENKMNQAPTIFKAAIRRDFTSKLEHAMVEIDSSLYKMVEKEIEVSRSESLALQSELRSMNKLFNETSPCVSCIDLTE